MLQSDIELMLPFLERSSYDLRVWRGSHLYVRIDRKEDPEVFIAGELLQIWHQGNIEELQIQRIKKITIQTTVNIVLEME